jgi:hypothetical protein
VTGPSRAGEIVLGGLDHLVIDPDVVDGDPREQVESSGTVRTGAPASSG